jgi:3-phenylpropionate/trans-cinnamate dioxygenase ferredoxin subunit
MEKTIAKGRSLDAGPSDLAPGERRIITEGSLSIGVFHVGKRYFAIRNFCPHEAAQLCRGKLTGTTLPVDTPGNYEWGREGMILRCPWHGWEFDLETGCHLADPSCRVRTYPVVEKSGRLYVEIGT